MSLIRKCDVCKKEIVYGIDEKARGLVWGQYKPDEAGKKPFIFYSKNDKDILLEDVCPECMEKIMEYIKSMSTPTNGEDYIGGSK